MFDFPTTIVQLIWLAIPIFTLLISIKARQRQPDRGGNLMVVGSAILTLSAFVTTAVQMGDIWNMFGVDSYVTYYMISSVVSIIGQVIFLVGLYRLVEGGLGPVGDKDIFDHLPD